MQDAAIENHRADNRTALMGRRAFMLGSAAGLGALALSGCTTIKALTMAEAEQVYGPLPDERFPIEAVNLNKVDPKYWRRIVRYDSAEAPGTIIVDPRNHYVYRIEGDNVATRYGVSVGRAGFQWKGTHKITAKKENPDWTAPAEMIARQPDVPRRMKGGDPMNPLGTRAMYLGSTLYRIHGSPDADSVGEAESSGCFRMRNTDVADLYSRVPVGTTVVVK